MGRPKGSKNKSKEVKETKEQSTPKKGKKSVEAAPMVETPKVEAPAKEPPKPEAAAEAARLREVTAAMERFAREVKPDDPDIISKWMDYIPGPKINW